MSFSELRRECSRLIGNPKAALFMAALAYRFPEVLIMRVIDEDDLVLLYVFGGYLDEYIKTNNEDKIRVYWQFKTHCDRSPEEREEVYQHLRGVKPPERKIRVRDPGDNSIQPDGTHTDYARYSKIKVTQRDRDLAESLKNLPNPWDR